MFNKRKINFTFLLIGLAVKLFSQQDPQLSMYLVDKMLINPAFAGSSNWAVGTLKYRQSITGFDSKFSTQTFNFHTPIQSKHLGFGIKIVNDNRSVINNLNFGVDISYHLNLAGGKLSLGLESGFYKRTIKYDDIVILNWHDPVFIGNTASTIPDFSFGAYYQRKQFYVGLSRMHLAKTKFDKDAYPPTNSILYPHHYLIAGNVFDVNKKISIEPSILLKTSIKGTLQMDLNTMVCYDEKVSAGIQWRPGDAVLLMAKYCVNERLRISYSYDIPMGNFYGSNKGAHEIVISYGVNLPPPPVKKEIHPRYYF